MSYIDDLMQFGLTRQESAIYYALLSEGMMTGYEAAKVSGVSRSNAYTALAALVDKGAAHVAEGTPTHYVPVDPEEFCGSISLSAVSRISVSVQPVCLTRHNTEST